MSEPPSKKAKMDPEMSPEAGSGPPLDPEASDQGGGRLADSRDMFESSQDSQDSRDEGWEWSGVPLSSLPRLPPHGTVPPPAPPQPSAHHTVAVEVPLGPGPPAPHPAVLQEVWDGEHVRLPWARDNLYPVHQDGRRVLRSRWSLVTAALAAPLTSTAALEAAVMSYNTRYTGHPDWSFAGFHHLFAEVLEEEEAEAFFATTLPGMVALLLSSPAVLTAPLPLLKAGMSHSITLSQHQVSVLLVNAFFCTFPRRNAARVDAEFSNYPAVNFNALFGLCARRPAAQMEKLKCLLCYFSQAVAAPRHGLITYTRRHLHPPSLPPWGASSRPLAPLHLAATGRIEAEGAGMLQADFANKFLGGGVLRSGLVQEEIRFTICPELLAGMVFTEALLASEAVEVVGVEQYSEYSGYGDSFRFEGRHKDATPRDASNRRLTAVVAMDAISFRGDKAVQFQQAAVERELNKAFAAFRGGGPAIATGNWGCGAFGGDPRLKLVLQLAAASQAGRPLAYFTFGDHQLVEDGGKLYAALAAAGATVAIIHRLLATFSTSGRTQDGGQLFAWIHEQLEAPGRDEDATSKVEEDVSPEVKAGVYEDDTDSCGEDSATKALKDLASEYNRGGMEERKEGVGGGGQAEGGQGGPHAQGLLAILDSMEKGEVVPRIQPSMEVPEVKEAKESTSLTPAKKQSKMTDFFAK